LSIAGQLTRTGRDVISSRPFSILCGAEQSLAGQRQGNIAASKEWNKNLCFYSLKLKQQEKE
jgi:hypothetical protein